MRDVLRNNSSSVYSIMFPCIWGSYTCANMYLLCIWFLLWVCIIYDQTKPKRVFNFILDSVCACVCTVCLCVCMCECACVCARACACANTSVFPISFHLMFWGKVSHWTWSPLVQHGWLARESQGPSSLHLPLRGQCPLWDLTHNSEEWNLVLILTGQTAFRQSYLPALKEIFLFA